jgi:glutamine amidotransferase
MQVMFDSSEEGQGDGLGLVPGRAVRFGAGVKVPHMGWNTLRAVKETPILEGIGGGDYFYFVHSFYPVPSDPAATAALTDYGGEFTSVVSTECIHGCQFHPEKSGKSGAKLLRNFLGMVKR